MTHSYAYKVGLNGESNINGELDLSPTLGVKGYTMEPATTSMPPETYKNLATLIDLIGEVMKQSKGIDRITIKKLS